MSNNNNNNNVSKVIYWELVQKVKFDHTNKKYMHKTESVFENETHKILWDFDIANRSPNLGQTTKPRDSQQQKKKKKKKEKKKEKKRETAE